MAGDCAASVPATALWSSVAAELTLEVAALVVVRGTTSEGLVRPSP